MSSHKASWTTREIETVVRLFQQGISLPQIALRIKRKTSSVASKLRRMGYNASELFSPKDDTDLYRLYPRASWAALEKRFPGMDHKQIQQRGNKLGITRKGSTIKKLSPPGMRSRFEYDMTEDEWNLPAKQPPRDKSKTIHPALRDLFA
jgi:hypothetical protein